MLRKEKRRIITKITVANMVMSRRPDGMFAQGGEEVVRRVQISLQVPHFHAKEAERREFLDLYRVKMLGDHEAVEPSVEGE